MEDALVTAFAAALAHDPVRLLPRVVLLPLGVPPFPEPACQGSGEHQVVVLVLTPVGVGVVGSSRVDLSRKFKSSRLSVAASGREADIFKRLFWKSTCTAETRSLLGTR